VLRWRLVSSFIVLSILIGLMISDYRMLGVDRPGVWLGPLVFGFAALAVREMLDLFSGLSGAPRTTPITWTTYVGTLCIVAAWCAPIAWKQYPVDCPLGKLGWPMLAITFGIGLAFLGEMLRYREPGDVVVRVAMGMLIMVYVGVLSGFLVALRLFHSNTAGMMALISTIAIVKMSDTGAYAFGRLFGRHPMAKLLSPKKTIEGALGGVLASVATAWLVLNILAPRWFPEVFAPQAAWRWIAYGTVLAAVGMVGDLAESLIKRDGRRKDSSSWLPGLGGVLDMLDSLLLTAPVSYACWIAGLIAPLANA
jgi:phosphatidate cytidylyltransferase